MNLTPTEKKIYDIIQHNPLLSVEEIAGRVGISRASASVHLSNLSKKGWLLGRGFIVKESQNVVVVGGANIDYKHQLRAPSTLASSNPSRTYSSFGGVGRNIAQNLAQLAMGVDLLSVIGLDALGEQLLAKTRLAGVNTDHIKLSQAHTGSYSAILEPSGELVIAVAAMDIFEELDPEYLRSKQHVLEHASLIVLDSNIPEMALLTVVELAAQHDWRLIIDPVSVAKASKLHKLLGYNLHTLTPNQDELAVLVNKPLNTDDDLLAACYQLHVQEVQHVWVRLGARGSLLSSQTGEHHWIPAIQSDVTDVTGAGDAALAGYIYGLLEGASLADACLYGHAAASLTLASTHTVNPELTPQRLTDLFATAR